MLSAFIFLLALSSAPSSPHLTRFPYIQRPTTTSATIVWKTDIPASSSIEYGLTAELGSEVKPAQNGTLHVAELTSLKPNETYYYRVLAEGLPLMDTRTFQTNKDELHANFSFIVFGDSGTGNQNQLSVAAQMLRVKPDLGLITGDIVYPNGAWKDYDAKYFRPYRDMIASVCFYPAPGNHDYHTKRGKPYLDNFFLPKDNPEGSEKYYSFDYANAHFVSIDSNLPMHGAEETKQFDWLGKDLSSTRKTWKFVFLHHPPYSASLHGGDRDIRGRYCPVFEKYSVDIVFCGHDHNYQRTVRINQFVPDKEGVIYVVTGGGGGRLYGVEHREWTAFAKKTFHFVHVKIKDATLQLSAIDSDGKTFDELALDKRLKKTSLDKVRVVSEYSPLLLLIAGAMILRRYRSSSPKS